MKHLPATLLRELHGVKGFDEQAFVAAHNSLPVTSVRINPYKDIGLFRDNERVPWCGNGIYLPERPVFTLDPAYHGGAYYVQEASSMFLDHLLRTLLDGRKDLRVLDLCAAPGGKSTLIASLLDADSLLVSNEVIRSRASILDENMTRWGYMNTWVCSNDPAEIGRLKGYFDVIVVDAPCSGSGLFRKDPHALEEWSEANVQLCHGRQQRILADIWPALKEDGILVYATCSYSQQEDEDILDWLNENFNNASLDVPVKDEWGIVTVTSGRGMTGYRFFPDKVKGEGFFIAALQKKEAAPVLRVPKFKTGHDRKVHSQAAHFLKNRDVVLLPTENDNYSAILPGHEEDWHALHKAVYLRKTGLRLGMPTAKEWLPAHDIALSIDANNDLPAIEVNKEQALRFLKREDLDMPEITRGWYIVKYRGLGLGWLKSIGNRFNNHLPKHWRIRMDIHDDSSDADLIKG